MKKKDLLKLDYGAGYNPKKSFKTADINGRPDFFIKDCKVQNLESHSCSTVYMKNVFHHILEPQKLNKEVSRILHKHGKLVVIEPFERYYRSNILLDQIWYRAIAKRSEINWSPKYRDPKKYFTNFKLLKRINKEPYEIFVFAPRS